jgi:hypothetical protein
MRWKGTKIMPTVERLFPSGAWLVSDIINGQYVKQRYMGYTKKEAIANFKRKYRIRN